MTERDFERMTDNSTRWGDDWRRHDGRFENSDKKHDTPPSYDWEMAYWLGDNAAAVPLCRSFLTAQGFESELLWDMAEHPNGELMGYVLLTDYMTASWAKHEEIA